MQEHFDVTTAHEAVTHLGRVTAPGDHALAVHNAAGELVGHVVAVQHDDAEAGKVAEARLAELKNNLAQASEDVTVKAKTALEKAIADLEAALARVEGDVVEEVRLVLGI